MRIKLWVKVGFLVVLFSLFAFTIGLPSFSYAETEPFKKAPVNKAFLDFLKNGQSQIADDGHMLGHVPPVVDLSHVRGIIDKRVNLAYPASYDLRTLGKLNPVRDQGGCGSCWTFGTYASLESFLKPAETKDFSEQDLNVNHGFDWLECEGGNEFMSQAYLSRWSGPLDENDVPYPWDAPAATFAPLKHVQQVVFLPQRDISTDNDTIKYFVTTYGALNFSFYWSATYWNAATNSFYNNVSTGANHQIAIVGWNDAYDKTRFATVPAGNGAFICRNSWGTSWGESGYFYMSYYDTSLQGLASFNNAEAVSNYKAVYQYDPLGWVWNNGFSSTTGWAANIFTATASQSINAVGFITNDADTAYTIYVYKGVTAGQPRSGTLAATKTGTNTYPGYYTVKLDSPVSLTNGEIFSVVLKVINPTYTYPIVTEGYLDEYASGVTSNPGESYKSADGTTWTDWYDDGYNDNNTIKAFVASATVKKDFIGTWDGQGVYYRNTETAAFVKLATPATLITAGDLDGDGIDDLIGIWPGQGGVWALYSQSGSWAKLSTTARDIATGDMNGDGRVDLVATWDGQGVYYRNSIGGAWVKMATPATQVTAGDLDGDGKDDPIGIWPGQGGVWVKYSQTGSWAKLSTTAVDIACGDMNGDGRDDLVATWDGQGVYYRNSIGGAWVKLATPATLVAAGDLDGDGKDDPIGIWPAQAGVWVKYSQTGSWAKLSTTARHIAAGLMRGGCWAVEVLAEPIGGFAEGPGNFGYQDLSEAGPGGLRFLCREEKNLMPLEDLESALRRMPGPDEYGFQCLEQENLIPGSGTTKEPEGKEQRKQP